MRAYRDWFRIMPAIAAVLAAVTVVPLGCERRPEEKGAAFEDRKPEWVVAVVLDTSVSFSTELDRAYRFFVTLTDRYFRDRVGSNDELVIAQISGRENSLLWRGSPRALRQRFPNAQAFKQFVLSKSDANGSRVHDALADTIDEVMSRPGVAEGRTRSAVLVLSDMEDNAPDAGRSLQRALEALRSYRRANGVVGLYWVEQARAAEWRRHLKDAGFAPSNGRVETDITEDPPLPSFD